MEIFTVSFFGHRKVSQFSLVEERLEAVIQRLLEEKEYVEFLVGRSGEFDQLASSAVRRTKRTLRNDNSALRQFQILPNYLQIPRKLTFLHLV